ncbi:hypothetical protein [Streptomyces sp. NPDC059389]|uniref:hypothetical protein n=1 Tax=Streptomyces sp. NPDC059389 TaxID=3346818 RepID=UPI0036C30485
MGALPLLALKVLHAGTFQVSPPTFTGWLPHLVFSLPAGVVADWFDQRKIMIFCDVTRMLLIASVPLVGLAGGLSLPYNTAALSYRQVVCPPELQSRVSAVYLWICYGVIPLGSLFGGTLATAAGLEPTLWVCVTGMWSAALFVVFSPLRTLRDVPGSPMTGGIRPDSV